MRHPIHMQKKEAQQKNTLGGNLLGFSCEEISRPAVLWNIYWLSMMTFFIYLMHNTARSANIQVSLGRLIIVKETKCGDRRVAWVLSNNG